MEDFIAKMVDLFREVRRVLKPTGTCWVNLGDSYATSGSSGGQSNSEASDGESAPSFRDSRYLNQHQPKTAINGLKTKDLCGVPWRVALALQADGWWLRAAIIWAKPNPMPESVTDRPTKSHEHIFLLTKSARYFYDAEAVREPPGRNLRDVWTISTEPCKAAHFATYPTKLVEKCVKAGSSEYGCCAACGKPWERVVEKAVIKRTRESGGNDNARGRAGRAGEITSKTTGWRPTCECNAETVPSIVLDCFMGSGTTAVVAQRTGRNFIGFELNPEYIAISDKRLAQGVLPL